MIKIFFAKIKTDIYIWDVDLHHTLVHTLIHNGI